MVVELGPIASALITLFGARSITIAGSIISALALMTSSLAPSLGFLSFSVGIVCGNVFSR